MTERQKSFFEIFRNFFHSRTMTELRLLLVLPTAIFALAARTYFMEEVVPEGEPARRYLYFGEILSEPGSQKELRWLRERKQAQLQAAAHFQVFHDFRFVDRCRESQIIFKHQIVDDAGKLYKPVHYDHGNGLAVADVDGDDRYDIYFVSQLGSNELWRNLDEGRFENITHSAGVGMTDRISVSASFADIDNDGDQDLYVTTVRMGNTLFENLGAGKFKDITSSAGLDYVGHSSGAVFFDYDRDGLLDLFLTNVGVYTTNVRGRGGYFLGIARGAFAGHLHPERAERSILYRNLGNKRFVDVSQQVGLMDTSWSGDAGFADPNEDSFPDLYVLNMQGNDHYYENLKGTRFVDRTDQLFPKTPWGSMGIKFFDYNNDGLLDLFVTDMHSDMSDHIHASQPLREKQKSVMKWEKSFLVGYEKSIWGNAFYQNLGKGRFIEVSDQIGVENYWPWGCSVGDLNADGFADVVITASMNYPFRYGINSVLLNNQGRRFLDSEFVLGIEPRRDDRTVTPWFEVDCSGVDKEYPECTGKVGYPAKPSQKRPQDYSGRFTVMAPLGSRSSAIFDIDGDGDLDIVTNELNAEPQLLVSNLSPKRTISYLKVNLIGTKSNRNGLGAKVTLWAGGLRMTQFQDGKSGYLSQSVLPLYFGLGEAKRVERIEVRWPSGHTQMLSEGIRLNTTLEMTEDTSL